jgi:hypothetical protein
MVPNNIISYPDTNTTPKVKRTKKAAGLAMFAMSGMDLVLNLNYLAHEYMWTEFLNEDRTSLSFS